MTRKEIVTDLATHIFRSGFHEFLTKQKRVRGKLDMNFIHDIYNEVYIYYMSKFSKMNGIFIITEVHENNLDFLSKYFVSIEEYEKCEQIKNYLK